MRLAQRYARIRPEHAAHVAENGRSHIDLSELELQARFFAGEFGRHFITPDGEEIELIQFGIWNREAGPDFSDAAVSVDGGKALRGCIELDTDARDWERHGHALNADYNSVVLHVFTRAASSRFYTRTSSHRNVAQVQVDPSKLSRERLGVVPLAKPGRCMAPLRDLPEEKLRSIIDAAAQFRLAQKAARFSATAAIHGDDEALYQALAATLGYKSNKLAFVLLAQRLPLRLLRENRGDIDALLFGVSGFLPGDLSEASGQTRSYLRSIWRKWWRYRGEYERLMLPRSLWRLRGQRPANHPQRRVAALAQIVKRWTKTRAVAAACEPAQVLRFSSELHDDYWSHHYTLSAKKSAKPLALVGRSRAVEMLANVFFPLAVQRDPKRWKQYASLRAALANRRAETAAARLFGRSMPRLSLPDQQALLQIFEDFCMQDESDCTRCLFPQQIAQWH